MREFLYFEWVVYDNCNLQCAYCVNRGSNSHRTREEMIYVPGREVVIARRIVELAAQAKTARVTMTGGEPLLAQKLPEVLEIFARQKNLKVHLLSNLRRLPVLVDAILPQAERLTLLWSIHIQYRTEEEIESILQALERGRGKWQLIASQVDHELSWEDRKRLAQIEARVGQPIAFQTFIPPSTPVAKLPNGEAIARRNFVSTRGRRCCLGYSHFLVQPHGGFLYDLWCQRETCKQSQLLELTTAETAALFNPEMKKCNREVCGCNYNLLEYAAYRQACERLGYPEAERMQPINTRASQRLQRWRSNRLSQLLQRLFH